MYIERFNKDGQWETIEELSHFRLVLDADTRLTISSDGKRVVINKSNTVHDRLTIYPECSNVIIIE